MGGFDSSATGEPLCKAMTVAHLFTLSSALFQTFCLFRDKSMGGFDGSATGEPLCKAMTVAHLFTSSSALFQTFLFFLELQASLLTLNNKIKNKHLCVLQGTFWGCCVHGLWDFGPWWFSIFNKLCKSNLVNCLTTFPTRSHRNLGVLHRYLGTKAQKFGWNLGTLHRNLGALCRNLGALHRSLAALHRNLGTLHRILGALHRNLGEIWEPHTETWAPCTETWAPWTETWVTACFFKRQFQSSPVFKALTQGAQEHRRRWCSR